MQLWQKDVRETHETLPERDFLLLRSYKIEGLFFPPVLNTVTYKDA